MRKITVLFFTTSLNTVGPAKALVNIESCRDSEAYIQIIATPTYEDSNGSEFLDAETFTENEPLN